jgi:hypothetical protein
MIIGYEISGYDNDSHMTGNWNRLLPEIKSLIPKCAKCGYRLDYRFINPYFNLTRKTLDYSATYDGVTIVSLKFKEFCIRYGYGNLEFGDLPGTSNFYTFSVIGNELAYNFRAKEKLCERCGQYESVIGPSLNLDTINEPLTDGFYQSNIWFAGGNEKSPITIIAPSTRDILVKEKFKGICFTKVEK